MLNSVARTLREARVARGWSLKQASVESTVVERFLRELEDGGSEVPVDMYRREFLRRYAKALSLPAEDLWKTFQNEKQLLSRQPSMEFREQKAPSRLHGPRQWRTFIGALTFSTILLYVLFSFTRVWAAPDLVVQFPLGHLTVNSTSLTVRGSVSADATITINGTIVVPTPAGTFEEPIVLGNGLNTITIQAIRKNIHSTSIVRHVYLETK